MRVQASLERVKALTEKNGGNHRLNHGEASSPSVQPLPSDLPDYGARLRFREEEGIVPKMGTRSISLPFCPL